MKTLQRAITIIFLSLLTVFFNPVMAQAALKPGDSITLKFNVSKDAKYAAVPDGYWYNEWDTYTCFAPATETESGTTIKLLGIPWSLPRGKQFIGWESPDGRWLDDVPLSLLKSANDGEEYTFTAVYKDCLIDYGVLNGTVTLNSGLFVSPNNLFYAVDGFNVDEKSTYRLPSAEYVIPNSDDLAFAGWEMGGKKVTSLQDIEGDDTHILFFAIFEPITGGAIAYCNAYEGIESITSLADIPAEARVTVNGGVAAYDEDTGSITPVPSEIPRGKAFAGWDVYKLRDMTDCIATAAESFNTQGMAGDLVFIARWENESYPIAYFDIDGHEFNPPIQDAVTSYTYSASPTEIALPQVQSTASSDTKMLVWTDGANYYESGATYTIPADTVGNITFRETLVDLETHTVTLSGLLGVDADSIAALEALGFAIDRGGNATISRTIKQGLTVPAITWAHHEFNGWQQNGSTDSPTETVVLEPGDIQTDLGYTATFTAAKSIKVNFDLNGGAFQAADIKGWDAFGYVAGTNESITAYEDEDLAAITNIPTPAKANNVFTGWTVDGSTAKVMSYVLPAPNDQVVSLKANWTPSSVGEIYELKFDVNGGKESYDPVQTNQIKSLPTPTRDGGYRFVCWKYEDGTVAHIGDAITRNTTLTAEWNLPEEIIPTKNGVIVEKNGDGENTVTLLDGSRYGKSATINTVAGLDKKVYKVTRIGDSAFAGDAALTAAKIGDNVKNIGAKAFSGCENLKSLDLGSGVETIGASAFNGCTSLSSFTANLENIPSGLFKGCVSLTKLSFGKAVKSIGASAFEGCVNLKKAPLNGASLETIGNKAFANSGITAVSTGKGVKYIGFKAFSGCEDLKTLDLGSGVETIGNSAFSGCTSLSSFTANLENIPSGLFKGCVSLTKLSFGKAVKSIGASAFEGCVNLKKAPLNGASLETIGNRSFAGSGITDVTTGKNVSTIGGSAFENCANLKSAKIGDNVRYIGAKAFGGCENLKTLDLGSGVETIGNSAFSGCTSLSSFTANLENIPSGLFKGCVSLTKLSFGKAVKSIGASAFEGCVNLKKAPLNGASLETIGNKAFANSGITAVSTGKGVKAIGDSAFAGCNNLASVTIGNAVETIGANAFDGCEALETLSIGSGVITIGTSAFNNCAGISTVTIGMTNIPNSLFKGYTNLTKLSFGRTVKSIGNNAFEGCINLKKVPLNGNLETIGARAFAGSGIAKADIAGKVTTIGNYAFYGCPNLTAATAGKSVRTIGSSAFAGCNNLANATIGASVSYIGTNAYSGDTKLGNIKVDSMNLTDQSKVGDNFLKGIKADATIKLPKKAFAQTKAVFEAKSGAGEQVKYK